MHPGPWRRWTGGSAAGRAAHGRRCDGGSLHLRPASQATAGIHPSLPGGPRLKECSSWFFPPCSETCTSSRPPLAAAQMVVDCLKNIPAVSVAVRTFYRLHWACGPYSGRVSMHSRYKGFNDRNEHSYTYAVRLIDYTLERQVSIREEYSHHVSHHAIRVGSGRRRRWRMCAWRRWWKRPPPTAWWRSRRVTPPSRLSPSPSCSSRPDPGMREAQRRLCQTRAPLIWPSAVIGSACFPLCVLRL